MIIYWYKTLEPIKQAEEKNQKIFNNQSKKKSFNSSKKLGKKANVY